MSDSPFEKTGNATWAQCPGCGHWFHISNSLIAIKNVDLICPGCGKEFPTDDAAEVVRN